MPFNIARVRKPITQVVKLYTREQARRMSKQYHIPFKLVFSMTRVINGEQSFTANVPIVLTGSVPEMPEVIQIGSDYFVKENDSPLSYRAAVTRKATRR